jgi:FlaA1/EpsC-like NDP-sugar epimerase/lipopolysaccharide/colanic/teichoic acid biosynthesis glycosyltransferase
MLKRCFDITTAALGLIILSPLFLFAGLGIAVTSRGPIFFRQLRVGRDGINFRIFKFRTMKAGASTGSPVTVQRDARITRFGRYLRITKIDELPQLINVLLGHMSIVGPRPEIPELVAFYTPEQHKLLNVKPGITSPAAIYHRDEEEIVGTDEEVFEYHKNVLIPKKASFDLAYVEKASFLYDVKLILLTLVSVFTNQSGYMRDHALKQRRILIFLVHLLIAALAYYLAFLIRFDAQIPYVEYSRFLKTISVFVLVKIVYMALLGLTHGYWRFVDIKDVISIGKAVFLASTTLFFLDVIFLDPAFPTGVIFIDGILTFILFSLLRFSTRFLREAYYPIIPKSSEKILILGATDRGEALIRDITRNPDLAYEILGLIDLNPAKRGVRIHGFKVLGTIASLEGILRDSPVTVIINTYSTLSRQDTLTLSRLASRYNVRIKTLPSFSDVLSGHLNMNKLRELKHEDLLGREEVCLDKQLLEKIYRNRTIMVTGAGGSIGSELVRQITNFRPKQVLLLDKDETLLYNIKTDLAESNTAVDTRTLIGDIRHFPKMEMFFNKFKPQIILHAAAYKHVPLLEEHPHEAVQNNVYGTRNILHLAQEHGAERFVMVSTDKAVRPTNVMGASKALAERLMFECYAPVSNMKCMAVRFGNVLGSRGSVIPIFHRQIEKGGPVIVTHKDISRYFMSIPEAAQLVLQAGAMGRGGEIFILKMGDPVKIRHLACRMIEHSGLIPGVDIQIEFSGLRPGEKVQEELLTELEGAHATEHEKIYVASHNSIKEPLILDEVYAIEKGIFSRSNREIRDYLQKLVPDYHPASPID